MERSTQAASRRLKPSKLLIVALAGLMLGDVYAADDVLRVWADPQNLPQSNQAGEGYENKIAEALARDLNRRVEYTFFPQRMGFVRNTLRAKDDKTQQWKCDVIIGVPKGYELTATTQPYMRSTYAIVFPGNGMLKDLKSPAALTQLPAEQRKSLKLGIFARSPGADWLLKNGLSETAVYYAPQSGDPAVNPANVVERDLQDKKIDAAVVWGPVAGYLVGRHNGAEAWRSVPFPADPQIRFDFEIAMGVRFGEADWKSTLDQWIAAHGPDIETILTSYHVPLIAKDGGAR